MNPWEDANGNLLPGWTFNPNTQIVTQTSTGISYQTNDLDTGLQNNPSLPGYIAGNVPTTTAPANSQTLLLLAGGAVLVAWLLARKK
jgi:hypothetical protein